MRRYSPCSLLSTHTHIHTMRFVQNAHHSSTLHCFGKLNCDNVLRLNTYIYIYLSFLANCFFSHSFFHSRSALKWILCVSVRTVQVNSFLYLTNHVCIDHFVQMCVLVATSSILPLFLQKRITIIFLPMSNIWK